jgi:AraC-like DNA-binding protein
MLRVQPLFDSALVSVERIDHPAEVPHVDPPEEVSRACSINFLERGGFAVQHRRRRWTVGTEDLFVTVPGHVYRYDHDDATDVVVSVCFKHADPTGFAKQPPVVRASNRRRYLRRRLMAQLHDGADALAIDSIAGELLAGAFDGGASDRLCRPAQLDWYASRIDFARQILDHDYATPHTLSRLSRTVGMSPYHFARVFRELTGAPPHRYLLRRRLAAAVERLRDGGPVTETCFAVGFQSLSHFIHSFRRAFGASPSRYHHRLDHEKHADHEDQRRALG